MPRQLKQHVVEHRHLFDGFRSGSDSLDAGYVGLVGKISVDHAVEPAHQACASTEIGKRAVNHVMSAIGPEIGFAVREEVQHYQATFGHIVQHAVLLPAPLPLLDHPFRRRPGRVHRFIYGLVGIAYVGDSAGVGSFMEGVHAVIFRCAHQLVQTCVIFLRHGLERVCLGVQDIWPRESAPSALGYGRQTCLGREIMGHHAGESGEHRLDAQFPHPCEDLSGQLFLTLIPPVGVLAAPSLEVVHAPPCLKAGSGNECVGLILCVAEILGQQIAPHHVQTYYLQRHVDAVKGHIVQFLLPAFPGPYAHGVRECAIVQIISVGRVGPVCLL